MDHTIIPQEWKKFLGVIQSKFPSAIIAGGALRDLIVDNPIKDVDIFISDTDMGSTIDFESIATLIGVPFIVNKDEKVIRDHMKVMHNIKKLKNEMHDKYLVADARYVEQESLGQQSLIESFINFIIDVQYDGIMYQLIFIEADPVSYVYTDFDFGICKVYFDGNALTVTEEFWYDLEHKQLTMSGQFSAGQMLHTMYTHRPNLIKKFPGWKVVIDDLDKRQLHQMPKSYQDMVAHRGSEASSDDMTVTYVYTDPLGVQRTRTKVVTEEERNKDYRGNPPIVKSPFEYRAPANVKDLAAMVEAEVDIADQVYELELDDAFNADQLKQMVEMLNQYKAGPANIWGEFQQDKNSFFGNPSPFKSLVPADNFVIKPVTSN